MRFKILEILRAHIRSPWGILSILVIPLGGGGDQQDWNMKSPLIPNCFLGLEFLI